MGNAILTSHNEKNPPGYPHKPGRHASTLTKLINHAHKTFDQPQKQPNNSQQMYAVHDAELARLITRYIDEKKQQKLHIPQEIISVQSYLEEAAKTSPQACKENT
jgi:hypothetical protein